MTAAPHGQGRGGWGIPAAPAAPTAPQAPAAPTSSPAPMASPAAPASSVPTSPSAPPAFGRSGVTAPVTHEPPGGHGDGPRRIEGRIQPRGHVPGRPPAPIPMSGFNPYQAPPAPEPREVVRRRASAARKWAIATAVLFGLGALATWVSYQSLAGSPLLSILFGFLSPVLYFAAVVSSGVLGAYAVATLRSLAERARRWEPPLARSHKTITAMHLWPGRNVSGPVVILAETGVRGPGMWAWFASCVLWPLALASVFWSNNAVGVFQTGVLAAIAAVTSAVTAASLTRAMSPPDPRRMVPGAEGDGDGGAGTGSDPDSDVDSEPFWSRGLVTPHRDRSPKTVIPPIDDAITSLYEENP